MLPYSVNLLAASSLETSPHQWDKEAVSTFRMQLLSEHLGLDTGHLDDRSALKLYRKIAHDNRQKRECTNFSWQGLAFWLEPSDYGE